MNTHDNTPIIVGVGQTTQQVPEDLSSASSHADIAAEAAQRAIDDTGCDSLSSMIDTIVGVRIFADSSPAWSCPFGAPDNFPRAVGKRIGAEPERAIYASVGGQTPQALVGEFSEKLHTGTCDVVMLVGGEVMANIKAATRQNVSLDWTEPCQDELEDRGLTDGDHLGTSIEFEHQLLQPMQFYGFMEQARRAERGDDLASYNREMGEVFSSLSQVAADNPYAQFPVAYTPEELITPTEKNRYIISPYTRSLVARDTVNQAAAIVLTTVGKARELGIAEDKWVFLHGYSNTKERTLLERPRIAYSKGMEQCLQGALAAAGTDIEHVAHIDIYSCFPIVVNEARDILGIASDDPRALTQTGGLPYFGGPGNNYSTHGLASLVEALRSDPGSYGLLYANGGWMSKHAAGVYSTLPPEQDWQSCDSTLLQAAVDAEPVVEMEQNPEGEAVLESYIINYMGGQPLNSVVIGRLQASGRRFYATNVFADSDTLASTLSGDTLGNTIYVAPDPRGNRYAYSPEALARFAPAVVDTFQESYEYCRVERQGRVLKVTMDRPDVRNALNPAANQELENIFNAYEKDKDLWVAVLTGAGDESFSAGNDLKAMASGEPFWVPKTGFAGLTARTGRTKPVIAAVNGSALGGGLEIAMACDIVVAAEHAVFGLPEVKVGLFAGMGGIQRISRQIGLKKAMELLLTGAAVSAEEAQTLGLINRVVPAGQLDTAATELALTICESAPVAVRSTMQMLNETAQFASVDDAVTAPHRVFDNLINSEDFYEGSKAFAEKRKPVWTGR